MVAIGMELLVDGLMDALGVSWLLTGGLQVVTGVRTESFWSVAAAVCAFSWSERALIQRSP